MVSSVVDQTGLLLQLPQLLLPVELLLPEPLFHVHPVFHPLVPPVQLLFHPVPLLFPAAIFTGNVELLFARTGSNVAADTCTLLLIVPAAVACTVRLRDVDDQIGNCAIFRV